MGTVYFGVWVKDTNSPTATFDANGAVTVAVTPPSCQSVTASANPASVPQGTPSTITAMAFGCTNANPQYEFWVRPASSSTWTLARSWSTSGTFAWPSAGWPVGTVYIGVWVKDSASPTSTFDANAATTVTVT